MRYIGSLLRMLRWTGWLVDLAPLSSAYYLYLCMYICRSICENICLLCVVGACLRGGSVCQDMFVGWGTASLSAVFDRCLCLTARSYPDRYVLRD